MLTINLVGSEMSASSDRSHSQAGPSIAPLKDGGFVVVWNGVGGTDGTYDGYAQCFDSSGNKVGTEFVVNPQRSGYQRATSVAAKPDGGFAVVWTSFTDRGIYVQHYDNRCKSLSSDPILSNPIVVERGIWGGDIQVASLSTGSLIVTFDGNDADGTGVYAQLLDKGVTVGGRFRVNRHEPGMQQEPVVASLSGDRFIISWMSCIGENQTGTPSPCNVYARLYDQVGGDLVPEFPATRAHAMALYEEQEVSVADLDHGEFIMVWQARKPPSMVRGVYGQHHAADGSEMGGLLYMNTDVKGDRLFPSVTGLGNNRFVAVWESPEADGSVGICGRLFDGLEKSSQAFRMNEDIRGDQKTPKVARLKGQNTGEFAMTWVSTLNGKSRVVARIFQVGEDPRPESRPMYGDLFSDLMGVISDSSTQVAKPCL